ncbi:hypothetical protein [Spirosoma sp.]|uniref:hypothetical protein n=1 Tax=Spirosoma sp. TaxID=1899569 RepID=UPI00261A7174|nr:hypothetical protein [Spirosoma sp.]MCX6213252.1 hypothetical protein [Spirosoma sp.]
MTNDLTGLRLFTLPTCLRCRYSFNERGKMTCSAYPTEIPDRIVFGGADAHTSVQPDQQGQYVFVEELT